MLKNRLSVGAHILSVGVTGWTIGGGHSALVRNFGLGVQNVLEFHVITADLNEIKRSQDTSLFYALRGGGSSFGVILDMKYKLYKDSIIEKFLCNFSAFSDGTPKVFEIILKSLQDFMNNAPREFGMTILPLAICDPTTKTCSASVTIDIKHYGEKATSSNLEWFNKLDQLSEEWTRKGLTGGGCRWITYPNYNSYAASFPASIRFPIYLGSSLVQKSLYSEQAIDALVRHMNETFYTSTGYMFISLYGGAVSDMALQNFPITKGWKGALFSVESSFILPIDDIKMTEALKQKTKALHQQLDAFSLGKYFNEAEKDLAPAVWKDKFWGARNYQKLVAIKKQWDPKNRFTCHQCVGSDFVE